MIKTIATSTSAYLKVSNTPGPYISPYTGGPHSVSGAMRFNPNSQTLEVYDGSMWQNVAGHTDISITEDMVELLDWAREQKNKQKEIEQWAKSHPTVRAALQAVNLAQEQLEIVSILCREEDRQHQ